MSKPSSAKYRFRVGEKVRLTAKARGWFPQHKGVGVVASVEHPVRVDHYDLIRLEGEVLQWRGSHWEAAEERTS